jgi:arginyl-tRNA synthetase
MAEKAMQAGGLLEESDGATIIDFSKHVPGEEGKVLGKALVRETDGTNSYLMRDVGALLDRQEEYGFDKMIYVVASDQDVRLRQLFKIVELTEKEIGKEGLREKISRVNLGLALGMSTRRGSVVFLEDFLDDVVEKMHEVMRKKEIKYVRLEDPELSDLMAEVFGISSVMVQDMSGMR